MTGSLSKSYGLTYANSVIQNVIPQNLTLSKQTNSINGTLSNEIISKIEKAIGTSVDCVRTAKESLDSAQKLLEKVEENMKAIAQRECQQVLKITLKEVDSRVSNLRSEVISWISNSNSINKTQLNMNPKSTTLSTFQQQTQILILCRQTHSMVSRSIANKPKV